MANTYTQIYIHIVFTVKGRQNLIGKEWKESLHKYICGITKANGQKLVVINSMPDHMHILVGLTPDIALSDLVRDIKANSSRFINEQHWVQGRFQWQEGFGAFSCSHSQLEKVITYIQNQDKHHARKTFMEEYLNLLPRSGIQYDARYLFEPVNG